MAVGKTYLVKQSLHDYFIRKAFHGYFYR